MFSIVESTVLRKEIDFDVTASIDRILGNLQLECNSPDNRKIALELLANTAKNLAGNKLYNSGEKIDIPLQKHNADSFTLKISDENGNAISKYRIMRCYC